MMSKYLIILIYIISLDIFINLNNHSILKIFLINNFQHFFSTKMTLHKIIIIYFY